MLTEMRTATILGYIHRSQVVTKCAPAYNKSGFIQAA